MSDLIAQAAQHLRAALAEAAPGGGEHTKLSAALAALGMEPRKKAAGISGVDELGGLVATVNGRTYVVEAVPSVTEIANEAVAASVEISVYEVVGWSPSGRSHAASWTWRCRDIAVPASLAIPGTNLVRGVNPSMPVFTSPPCTHRDDVAAGALYRAAYRRLKG